MHKVLGHLFVFIPFHKLVQQNWPWRDRENKQCEGWRECGGAALTPSMRGAQGSIGREGEEREDGREVGGGEERGKRKQVTWRLFPGRMMCNVPSLGGITQHPVLTRSVFIIVAEVQTNGSAEL